MASKLTWTTQPNEDATLHLADSKRQSEVQYFINEQPDGRVYAVIQKSCGQQVIFGLVDVVDAKTVCETIEGAA